jgi:spermidine synthase
VNNPFSKSLRFVILVTGASGIIAQIILIRELMVSFYGNELSIGLVLANWLILEALGSFVLGKTIERAKNKILLLSLFVIIFSLALPVMIYLARIIKNIIGAAPGETLSIPTMFLASFLILLPLSITHGALFTFSCNLFSAYRESEKAVGKVYVLETVGTIVGGIILPYLLIPYFSAFTIVFALGLINFLSLLLLLLTTPSIRLRVICGLLIILFGSLLIARLPERMQDVSISHQWRGHNVIYCRNSIYGNIVVTKQQEQYTFFEDGIPVINTPVPDIAFAEDFVHFSLLAHPNPKKVLIISGAAGGILTEILKHPVAEVDYVELDPLLLKAIEEFPTPVTTQELNDSRVKLIRQDARSFLREHAGKYDLILVNFLSPATLQLNRFFTKEFFALAKKRLESGGILASIGFGSLSYLSEDMKKIILSNWLALKSVFSEVTIIPGDFNLFLASSGGEVNVKPQTFIKRLQQRKIKTNLVTPGYILDRLSEYRLNWFWHCLRQTTDCFKQSGSQAINSDLTPHGVFYNLVYWSSLSTPVLRKFFNFLPSINLFNLSIIFLLLLIIGIFLVNWRFRSKPQKITIPFALFSTGFVGMVLNLTIILSFQSIYGYVYHQISILVTAFILGTALGGYLATTYFEKIKPAISFFLVVELLLILISLICPFVLFRVNIAGSSGKELIFPFLSLLVGFLVGVEFPLANKIYSNRATQSVGLLYGADLAGGFLGAILISIILIPILGILVTCLVVVIFKAVSGGLILIGHFRKAVKTKL